MTHPVLARIAQGARILDVRTPDEFAGGHYPGAANIPVQVLGGQLSSLGSKSAPIVVYCASGGRSSVAQQMLQAAGFADVTNGGGLYDMPRA